MFGLPARAARVYASEPALVPLVATVVAGLGIVVFQFDRILTSHPDVDTYGALALGTAETRSVNPFEKDYVHYRPFSYDHEDAKPGLDTEVAAERFLHSNVFRQPRWDWMPVGMRASPGRFRPRSNETPKPTVENLHF